MQNVLATVANIINRINAALGKVVSYATIAMAIVMFGIVVLRYGFSLGWIAMQESVMYLHAAVFLLGSAFTYQQNAHVRVDVFYRQYSKRKQAMVNLLGSLVFMLPVSLYIGIICFDYVIDSWSLLEGSREPGGLPFVYVLKSFLLIFAISMVLQAISEIITNTLRLLGHISFSEDENALNAKQQEHI
ncbi:TRAP transporter small permease subunit [Ningiella sp. W23]|uniref:TRAP transporter small permease subunit n=1 Tax=Ningiella sp. W23 TaxID=3023715 RepID=UPI0037579C1A